MNQPQALPAKVGPILEEDAARVDGARDGETKGEGGAADEGIDHGPDGLVGPRVEVDAAEEVGGLGRLVPRELRHGRGAVDGEDVDAAVAVRLDARARREVGLERAAVGVGRDELELHDRVALVPARRAVEVVLDLEERVVGVADLVGRGLVDLGDEGREHGLARARHEALVFGRARGSRRRLDEANDREGRQNESGDGEMHLGGW